MDLASMAKLYAAEVVQEVATEGVQVLGGYGYSVEYLAERYYRDAKIMEIIEGTTQIHERMLGGAFVKKGVRLAKSKSL